MSRKKKKQDPLDYITLPTLDIDPEIKKSILALFLLLLAIISTLALFGTAGAFGDYWNRSARWLFGWGRNLLPAIFLVWAIFIFFKEKMAVRALTYVGLIMASLALLSFFNLVIPVENWSMALMTGAGGGHLGYLMAGGLLKAFGVIAAFATTIIIFLIALMFLFNATLAHLLVRGSTPVKMLLWPFKFLLNKKDKEKDNDEGRKTKDESEDEEEENDSASSADEEENEDEDEEEDDQEDEEQETELPKMVMKMPGKKEEEVLNIWKATGIRINIPLDLMSKKIGKPDSGDVKANKEIIRNTLAQFGIASEMGDVSVGPTVAQYTLHPADGVKLSRITALNSDLAMSLAAHPIRIEAPIPGKALVGIEVPNKSIATVGLREILGSTEYDRRACNTMIALGKDVAGKVWLANLRKMPHLLVAGQTGSGKSVMLNTLIVSLLYQNNPDDLKFIMVDPKRVELTMYDGIPHLLTPVITDVSKTVNALKWCLNELDRRLRILQQAGKKDIGTYNESGKQKMPYIVFIIDELADLMIVAGKDVEPGIVRLAQLARAVGIHLVLATQRPSVNIITGTIKANMPARIAFAVASSIDSRTILDATGAEKLLGKGDMLFSDPSMANPRRIQGSFVSENEIKKIVNYIKTNAGPVEYMEGITERQKVKGMGGVGIDGVADDDDEMIWAAAEAVVTSKRASTTFLQTRLGLGYPRAAKIMEQLRDMGIIGEPNGSKPREILVSVEQMYDLRSGGRMVAQDDMESASSADEEEDNDELRNTKDESGEEDEEDEDEENDERRNTKDENEDEDDIFKNKSKPNLDRYF